MGEAVKCLYELSEEENIRLLCEGRERYRMDMDCAREEGIERGLREGRQQGMKLGHEEGEEHKLVKQICKKLRKNCSIEEIVDMLEEDEETIRVICDVASSFAPNYDVELIVESMKKVRCCKCVI